VIDRVRLDLRFDAAALQRDLARLEPSDWVDHFVPQHFTGTWAVLPLRAPAGATHPVKMIYSDPGCDTYVDTPLLAKCPAFRHALSAFECPLRAVRLMKLTPGSDIKPHRDLDLDIEHGTARLHVVVATNPAVEFVLNDTRVFLREGECWYLKLSDTHAVANRGGTDRIHLVLDAVVNPWLQAQIDLERLRDLGWRDEPLQRELAGIDDRDAFVARVVQSASAAGLRVGAVDVGTAMDRARRRRLQEPV